jgi:drug/metabolite transporter (DMT)-like permease
MLDALKFVSETYHRSHERRVAHELQVVIACLTFFAASAATTLSKGDSAAHWKAFFWWALLVYAVLCGGAAWYFKTSAESNTLDLGKARAADNEILEYLQRVPCQRIVRAASEPQQRPTEKRWIWNIVAVVVGAVLALLLIYIDRPTHP